MDNLLGRNDPLGCGDRLMEAYFEVRVSTDCQDTDEYSRLSAALIKAVEETIKEVVGWPPRSMSVVGEVPYPEAIFRLGGGRIK